MLGSRGRGLGEPRDLRGDDLCDGRECRGGEGDDRFRWEEDRCFLGGVRDRRPVGVRDRLRLSCLRL